MKIEITNKTSDNIYREVQEKGVITVLIDGREYDIKYIHYTKSDSMFNDYDNDVELELPDELKDNKNIDIEELQEVIEDNILNN